MRTVVCNVCQLDISLSDASARKVRRNQRSGKVYRCLSCTKAARAEQCSTTSFVCIKCSGLVQLSVSGARRVRAAQRSGHAYMCMPCTERVVITQQNRTKWDDSGFRARVTLASRAAWADVNLRRKQAEAANALWAKPEFAERARANFASSAFRDRMKAVCSSTAYKAVIAKRKSPEHRAKMAAIWQVPGYRERMAVQRANAPRISSLQVVLYKLLNDLGVTFHPEGDATAVGPYAFDCMVPKQGSMRRNLLIECQGDYWHSMQKAIVNDRSKFTYIERYFPDYEIMYVWEHEFSAKDRVLDRLKLKLGVNIQTVDFPVSDIVISESVSPTDVAAFLDAYHYIGKGRGGKVVVARHDDKLVAVCVLSPPMRGNATGMHGDFVELSRLCIHPSYHKKNFASWFIGKCVSRVSTSIVAYADTTSGHLGTVYKAANFALHHEVPPDYWYTDDRGWVMHKLTLYRRARKMSIAEAEYAAKYGYTKQWGGKKLCFTYHHRRVRRSGMPKLLQRVGPSES